MNSMCSSWYFFVTVNTASFSAVFRASAAERDDKYRDIQSKLAAEIAAHSSCRQYLAELHPKVELLTSLNQKLSAALAVAQLQTAVGVDDLLSQAIQPLLILRFTFSWDIVYRLDSCRFPTKRCRSRHHFYRKRRFELGFSRVVLFWCVLWFCSSQRFFRTESVTVCSSRKCQTWSWIMLCHKRCAWISRKSI